MYLGLEVPGGAWSGATAEESREALDQVRCFSSQALQWQSLSILLVYLFPPDPTAFLLV